MFFLKKKSKFWLPFLNNLKNLRLGKKTKSNKKKKKKKNIPALYSLHDKSNNLDFPWALFELIGLKNCQKPSKLKSKKNRRFSENSDIFLHLMLLLLLMSLLTMRVCLTNNWWTSLYNSKYNTHLHFLEKNEQKWNLTDCNWVIPCQNNHFSKKLSGDPLRFCSYSYCLFIYR